MTEVASLEATSVLNFFRVMNKTEMTNNQQGPGFVAGAERVSVCLHFSTEGVGGTQVPRAA